MKANLIAAAALSALCALLAAPPPAAAQETPRLTERGCGIVADMVLVARSLAVEKIDRALASRIMAQVYAAYAGAEAVDKLRENVISMTYGRTERPTELARLVGETCLRTGGDPDSMLGKRIRWRL